MSQNYPRFAVVGHPNKGKSSIVSTLAHDESVDISNIPGTTTKQRSYPLIVDGTTLYALYDTPGFQRARAVLAWLKSEDTPAHKRIDRVKRFIYEYRDNPKYQDEIELLEPILGGAGIIYVVDGSKPYGVEYEAEMQILQWTGQPSMALINLIDTTDYVAEWRVALGQYFQMVRLFNPMEANFSQHILLLESIAQLNEEWTSSIKSSIDIFKLYHQQKIRHSTDIIVSLIVDSLSYKISLPIRDKNITKAQENMAMEEYKRELRKIEDNAHIRLAKVWSHQLLQKSDKMSLFDEIDLFSKESETLFGLSRKELLLTGIAGGALSGSGVDMMMAGSSLMLGSALGALAGGVGVMIGYDKIAKIKILGEKLGDRYLQIGPIQNPAFPYIILQRAIYYTTEIATRPHANRADIEMNSRSIKNLLDTKEKKTITKLHQTLQNENTPNERLLVEYGEIINRIL
jgi:GTPase Era involved in 16S rRNA processing